VLLYRAVGETGLASGRFWSLEGEYGVVEYRSRLRRWLNDDRFPVRSAQASSDAPRLERHNATERVLRHSLAVFT
jgi:hypothetical protein